MTQTFFRYLNTVVNCFREYFRGDFIVLRSLEAVQTVSNAEELGSFSGRPVYSKQEEFQVVVHKEAFAEKFEEFILKGQDILAVFEHVLSRDKIVIILYSSFEFVALYGIDLEHCLASKGPARRVRFGRDVFLIHVCPGPRGEVGLEHHCVLFRGDAFSAIGL